MPDQNSDNSRRSSAETPSTIRYTVAPGRQSQITFQTSPRAVCTLHREEETDPENHLKLYADDDGYIRFHVRPSNEHESTARMTIECEADGKVTKHLLELRPHTQPTADMPPPPPEPRRRPAPGARVRPALLGDDLLRLPDDVLVNRGYPVRPDPDQAPGAFNAWRRAVSTPSTFIEPRQVARPDISHAATVAPPQVSARHGAQIVAGPSTSGNWSGFELRDKSGTYDWVTGMWHVPSVTGESNTHTYSAYWIGLDGDGVTDLVQDGTEQENYDFDFIFFHLTFSIYYAWTEFLPQQPTEQQIANFQVSPGDEIFSEVWIGNAGSMPTLSGAFGVFLFENVTTSHYTYIYTPVGSTKVGGSEAVWIMERPTVNGNLPDLADYNSAIMFNAVARRTNGSYVAYQGANNLQISMLNGSDTLSTVTPINSTAMQFNWRAFH